MVGDRAAATRICCIFQHHRSSHRPPFSNKLSNSRAWSWRGRCFVMASVDYPHGCIVAYGDLCLSRSETNRACGRAINRQATHRNPIQTQKPPGSQPFRPPDRNRQLQPPPPIKPAPPRHPPPLPQPRKKYPHNLAENFPHPVHNRPSQQSTRSGKRKAASNRPCPAATAAAPNLFVV